MFAMYNVLYVGCSGYKMFSVGDVGDVGYLGCMMFGCRIFGMCNFWDVGCGMLIYKMLFETKCPDQRLILVFGV